jgi:hypothetical protein
MKKNWITIKSSTQLYEIEILKGLLMEKDIPAVIINKQDSSYLNFGDIELKVLESDFEKATFIIKQKNE